MNLEQAKEMAMEMQRKAIKWAMLSSYVGDRRKIEQWDNFRFHLSTFCAWHYKTEGISDAQSRAWLNKLAAAGVITREQYKPRVPACYRFPREVCDKIAAEVIAHFQAIGYSQDEIRPKVTP